MGSPDTPTPAPPPIVPLEDPKVKAQRLAAEKAQMAAQGKASTMLTGPGGAPTSQASTASRALLGT
jgi:hypothetical protein